MLVNPEEQIVCSRCGDAFKSGQAIVAMVRTIFSRYSLNKDYRADPPVFFPVAGDEFDYKNVYHERCVK